RGHAAELVERHALDVLGDDVESALVQTVVDDAGDRGEAELGEQVELAPRAAGAPPTSITTAPQHHRRCTGESRRAAGRAAQELDGDALAGSLGGGLEDHAAAAGAEPAPWLEPPD